MGGGSAGIPRPWSASGSFGLVRNLGAGLVVAYLAFIL
jgi:hypothetical protein